MPFLPRELECEIFETAFRSDPKNAALRLSLCLVARRVQFWVDLIYYETVTISGKSRANQFLDLISRKLPGFFAVAVKILCLVHAVETVQAVAILAACPAVQHLACWVQQRDYPDLALLISRLPLSRLWIEFTHFLNVPVAFFSKLTHVELVFWESTGIQAPDIYRLIRSFQQLPELTHIALAFTPSTANQAHAEAICSSLPDLRVVIIVRDDAWHDYEELEMPNDYSFDARIVTFSRISMDDDWEATNFGHDNIWSHAEGVIAQRRARSGSPDRT
ncbi:hypothetical protein DFH07DRAFT_771165 [Mycena maculata]|uniref:Uncharacterized protein n=1 Tax=Mycena maculata TaxID=230809 RepID=A0AAD7JGZ4_9AGAR|nr:hypothetical protein DFH07DRAFT_771165 [Mycena maculata]